MSYTTTLHYVPKASWRSLSGSAQNRPVFESFRDDRLASVRVATGKGAAVEETVRKLVLTLPHARARSRPALTAGHGVTRGKFSHSGCRERRKSHLAASRRNGTCASNKGLAKSTMKVLTIAERDGLNIVVEDQRAKLPKG